MKRREWVLVMLLGLVMGGLIHEIRHRQQVEAEAEQLVRAWRLADEQRDAQGECAEILNCADSRFDTMAELREAVCR